MEKYHYSEKVDMYIYGIKHGCETDKERIDLILAILDQMGGSLDLQNEIKQTLYKSFQIES
jgi:hypothetical protein